MSLRTLHVVEPDELDWPALAALGLLIGPGAETEGTHEALCVGGSRAEERLRAAGLDVRQRVPPIRRGPCTAASPLGRAIRRLGPVDCVHAWSARSAAHCVSARQRAPVLVTLTTAPPAGGALERARLGRALGRAAHTVFAGPRLREAWSAWGAPTIRSTVVPLPLPVGAASGAARTGVRESWGVPVHEPVVLACGSPARAINARWFSYEVGVMSVAGLRATVVIPHGAAQAERGLRFAQRHIEPWRVVLDERPVWELAPGADIALWSLDGVSHGLREGDSTIVPPDSLAWCAALGVPIVCEDHPASREALAGLEDRARFVNATRPTALIDEVMEQLRSPRVSREPAVPGHRQAARWVERTEELHRAAAFRPRPLGAGHKRALSA